jgi:hypothetical protein
MDSKQRAHSGGFAQQQQEQARQAGQKKQNKEGNFHAVLLYIDDGRVPAPF